jgi:2-keto-3-deoxy-galactonokinase
MQGEKSDCLICVDTGTTNTRVWLLRGAEVLATARVGVGVRDTAREGTAASSTRRCVRRLPVSVRTRLKVGRWATTSP